MTKKAATKKKRWPKALFALFLILYLLLAAFTAGLWILYRPDSPLFLGSLGLSTLSSETMEPLLPRGSLLLLGPGEEAGVGEAVICSPYADGEGETLRLLEESGEGFLAKADRETAARQISRGDILYTVRACVPYLGYLWSAALTPQGRILFLAVLGCLVALFGWWAFSGKKKEKSAGEGTESLPFAPDQELDFNPVSQKILPRSKKAAEARPAAPEEGGVRKALVTADGEEIGEILLQPFVKTSIKTDGMRIDISVVPEDSGEEDEGANF